MKHNAPSVVYWNNIPSPYVVERLNALADRGRVALQAWFNDKSHPDRSWKVDERDWRFSYQYLPTVRILGSRVHLPLPILGMRPDLLVSLYAEPSFVSGWTIAKLRGIKAGFRVVKTFDAWVSRNPIKEAAKCFLFRKADAIETTGRDGWEYARGYGAEPGRIFITTQAIDVDYFAQRSQLTDTDRRDARAGLGLSGIIYLYVGRIWLGKGLGVLLDAFSIVQAISDKRVSLLLVGDGKDEAEIKRYSAEMGLRNVKFAGFQQKSELPKFYAIADVFVFPTLGDPYGLVVNEAMACSLPVIASDAAGEIRERVQDGVTGYVVPAGDPRALADRMLTMANRPADRIRMARRAAQRIAGKGPDEWASDFERMVFSVLDDSSHWH